MQTSKRLGNVATWILEVSPYYTLLVSAGSGGTCPTGGEANGPMSIRSDINNGVGAGIDTRGTLSDLTTMGTFMSQAINHLTIFILA